jgi:hypothetical protein
MKTCGTCGYFVPNRCKRLFKARLASDKSEDCDFHFTSHEVEAKE